MSQPNIILIIADDMGYGDFGIFNDRISCTPHLDALVEEGVCQTQHYSAAPVCAPARAALMTGRYAQRTGSNDTLEARGLDRLRLNERTLADILAGAGYATGLVGKWHNGALDRRYHPRNRGFDEFVGFQGGWNPYYRFRLDRNGAVEFGDGKRYLTDVFSEAALDFIERHQRQPFFLQLAYNAPHFPLEAPDAIARKYVERGFSLGVSLIYAMIEVMDAGIGRVIEKLETLGIADNTILMFTSDNGPTFGVWNGFEQRRFNYGFNGSKGNTYEGGIRVPMILRWRDGLPGGGLRSDAMAHFTDWLPTLLGLAHVPVPDNIALDGRDISAALRGEDGGTYPQRCWQWSRYAPVGECNAALREGDWKLVRPQIREAMAVSPQDTAHDNAVKFVPERYDDVVREPQIQRSIPEPPPALLFNIADDPGERNDLAAQHPQIAARLEADLERWFIDVTGI